MAPSASVDCLKLVADEGIPGATETIVPLVSQPLGVAEIAMAQMPGDGWPSKPTLFEGVSPGYWQCSRVMHGSSAHVWQLQG